MSTETQAGAKDAGENGHQGGENVLKVTDGRTGQSYELPIEAGTVRATELRQIKVDRTNSG